MCIPPDDFMKRRFTDIESEFRKHPLRPNETPQTADPTPAETVDPTPTALESKD